MRHPAYEKIVDVNDILLVDEPATYDFIDKIFATLSKTFTSRNVNIGMDEAHMVGRGKYMDKHGYADRYDLLIRHLHKVSEIAEKYGFKAHMWSDMFFRLASNGDYYDECVIPEKIKKCLPDNVDLTYWDYYHTEKSFYDQMIDKHSEFGHDVWFAGGTWTWNGFAPLFSLTVDTMKPAMQSVIEKNVQNVLITMWGDDGKECSYFSMLHGLYAIRQYADGNFDEQAIADGFEKTFGVSYADFALLDLPNRPYGKRVQNSGSVAKTLLYTDPFMGWLDKNVSCHPAFTYGENAVRLEQAVSRAKEYGYIFDCLSKLCRVLEIKAELGLRTRKAYRDNDRKTLKNIVRELTILYDRLESFHQSFYVLWNKENKPQGFEIHDARIGGVMRRVLTCKQRLQAYLMNEIEKIEELEEEILYYFDGKRLGHNVYTQLISMSKM